MAATPSTMLDLGTTLPAFRLRDINGKAVTSADFGASRGLLVAFICPHCPYERPVRSEFARRARDVQQRGISVIAINSNDATAFPDDTPDSIRQEASEVGYTFPYLVDDTQEVAKSFRA